MNLPRTKEDLQRLITTEVQESLHLEYKDSRELDTGGRDVPKEVSAFANSDGGILIFGISEIGHKPTGIDDGVDHIQRSREWLEDIITGNIAPRIGDLEIAQIPLTEDRSAYAVRIPKSHRGPHQERNMKRYYKRFNFKSEPMEDYEIADVRSRALTLPPLVSFDVEIGHTTLVYFLIRNIGNAVARDVRFNFSPEPTWRRPNDIPPILTRGIGFFPPGREFRIFYQSFISVFGGEKGQIVTAFDIQVTYTHSASGEETNETFHINLEDYLNTSGSISEVEDFGKKLCDSIKKLTDELQRFKSEISPLAAVAGPTGLDLSVTSIRELASIFGGSAPPRKLDPTRCMPEVFQEVLGIDEDMAERLSSHFWNSKSIDDIADLEGVDGVILEKFRLHFVVGSKG